MLTIGRFADATGLTVKALRHYHDIGLLEPSQVDPENGYRYYDEAQIEDAVAIRRLRALELPLDEIRDLLHADADTFKAGLAAHGYHVGKEAHDKYMLLLELAALDIGGGTAVELEIVDEPELRLAATIRQLHQSEGGEPIEVMCRGIYESLQERGVKPVGPPMALFRGGDRENWHIVEAGWPVPAEFAGDASVTVNIYEASRALSYDHRGSFDELHPVAQRFIATALGQGYRFSQPIRIVYLADEDARLVWPLAATDSYGPWQGDERGP